MIIFILNKYIEKIIKMLSSKSDQLQALFWFWILDGCSFTTDGQKIEFFYEGHYWTFTYCLHAFPFVRIKLHSIFTMNGLKSVLQPEEMHLHSKLFLFNSMQLISNFIFCFFFLQHTFYIVSDTQNIVIPLQYRYKKTKE